ncbi:MAG: GNAT family N-acetyltransferase [Edaphobacter sp.]
MMTPVLEGARLRLEPMTLGHLAGLEAVAFDERIWRYMLGLVKTREDLRGWVEKALRLEAEGTVFPWVTVLKEGNRVIGSTRFMEFDKTHMTTELGSTWLAPEFHGAGLNAEAKLLQLRFGFEELGLRRVALKTHHENLQSQAAMRKIGAVEEGRFRNHYVMPDGSQRHSVWFSIIREDWPQVKSLLEARVRATPKSA